MNFIKRTKIQYLHYPINLLKVYQPLEYITFGNGNQFETDFNATIDTIIEFKGTINTGNGNCFIGAHNNGRGDDDDYRLFIFSGEYEGSVGHTFLDIKDSRQHGAVIARGALNELRMGNNYLYDMQKNRYIFNGSRRNFSPYGNIYLCSKEPAPEYGTVYYFKIYDDENLIAHFIPVRRNTDGTLGLFDIINNKFLISEGTATAGPEV